MSADVLDAIMKKMRSEESGPAICECSDYTDICGGKDCRGFAEESSGPTAENSKGDFS